MIYIVALDDEPSALDLLAIYARQIPNISLESFTKPSEAKLYIESQQVDILLLDIEMPSINGLEFYSALTSKPYLILSTAYSQYAIKGFEIQALDYLLKPYPIERFRAAIDRVTALIEQHPYIWIKVDKSLVKLFIRDILYIESKGDYIFYITESGKRWICRQTLKNSLFQLEKFDFIQVNKSQILHPQKIKQISKASIILTDNTEIFIGKTFVNVLDSLTK